MFFGGLIELLDSAAPIATNLLEFDLRRDVTLTNAEAQAAAQIEAIRLADARASAQLIGAGVLVAALIVVGLVVVSRRA